MDTLVKRRRFTVDEYECMGRAGILHEDERVELVDGEIVEMPPIGPGHGGRTNRLNDVLSGRLSGRAIVAVQNPIRLSRYQEPQPDIALLRRRSDFYTDSHPGPEDVLLVIEVSDTTLAYDRDTKVPMYAAAGIPEVWIADVQHRRLLVYRRPENGVYLDVTVVEQGAVSPLAFPDLVIRLEEILG